MRGRQAFNPFLPSDVYIADGEPHVFDGRVYVFGSHDAEGGDSYCMLDYTFWSAPVDNLADWSCPGVSYSASQDPLCRGDMRYMYAPDVVRGNDGRYYLYYCLAGWKGKGGYSNPISVAVCDTPDGKYKYLGVVRNPDGTPYLGFICFDPAVMNDDGTIRLYFGTGPFRAMTVERHNAWILSRVYSSVFSKPADAFLKTPGPLGANTAVLLDDMLTLASEPVRILPEKPKGTPFAGHSFFEASSIRKIGRKYYFVYSSERNHELCYAVSDYPDKEFVYGGAIVSNGDIGINGRKEKDRLNTTATTHGSIECINGQWYVFYHRITHGSDYSRQMCAEKIIIQPDGSIKQAEMTSCGLNEGALSGVGIYPAAICCNLTNGHMPHTSNGRRRNIPMVSHMDNERFVSDAKKGTRIVLKYFNLSETKEITVTARGRGVVEIFFGGRLMGSIRADSESWTGKTVSATGGEDNSEICLRVTKGKIDIFSLELK